MHSASNRGQGGPAPETGRPALTWHVLVLALVSAITLFARFFHRPFYGFFEDDFFYYAVVARNLVRHHLSTFDGVHLTNGYHPLWLLVVTICYAVAPHLSFFVAIQCIAFAASILYYLAVVRCLALLAVPVSLTRPLALTLSLHALLLFRYGMEVDLTLPFGACLLLHILRPGFRWTASQTFVYGLLASLTILSRLDFILFVLVLLPIQFLGMEAPYSLRLRRLLIFALGCTPLLFYFALNLHIFHTLLPVSGSAKQLKPLWPPSLRPLSSAFLPLDRNKLIFAYPVAALVLCGMAWLARGLRRRVAQHRAVILALLFFPVVHFGLLCCLSDWAVWPWYFYSLSFAAIGAVAVLFTAPAAEGRKPAIYFPVQAVFWCASAGFTVYLLSYALFKQPPSRVYTLVAEFADAHPGRYAMGDGSGTPAFASTQPFTQLEGLMMDREYLSLLRTRVGLPTVLQRYGADYYVILAAPHPGKCLRLQEPEQAGPASPQMLGRVCAQPLATASEGATLVEIYHATDVLPEPVSGSKTSP